MLSDSSFVFLNQEGSLVKPEDWNDPVQPKLWLYNLHYFDDLLAEDAGRRAGWHEALIERWIEDNPPGHGNGWEPYVISRRIVNWTAAALGGLPFSERVNLSLATQARALDADIEFHLLGNHLFANAKALIFAGCYFEGAEAERWLARGLKILDRELDEQILSDGGHFERSPMYHSIILEDMVDLIQLAAIFPEKLEATARRQLWSQRTASMLDWLFVMTHPDGDIAFFNDAATGIASTLAHLTSYAGQFGVQASVSSASVRHLDPSGYVRLSCKPWDVFFDAAPIGPDYIPGHAHADTLAIEVSLDEKRLVTNGGTSTYATSSRREAERATRAHATVEIDGENSSEVWASFRVGRRARPYGIAVSTTEDGEAIASAAHDGYRFLSGKPEHRRTILVSPTKVSVRDKIDGGGVHSVVARFPLHPSVNVVACRNDGWEVKSATGRTVRFVVEGPVKLSVGDGFYAPQFGIAVPRSVLCWRVATALPIEILTEIRI